MKVVGFVASDPAFTGQPGVINGASELLGHAFGDAGRTLAVGGRRRGSAADSPVEVEVAVSVADDPGRVVVAVRDFCTGGSRPAGGRVARRTPE